MSLKSAQLNTGSLSLPEISDHMAETLAWLWQLQIGFSMGSDMISNMLRTGMVDVVVGETFQGLRNYISLGVESIFKLISNSDRLY